MTTIIPTRSGSHWKSGGAVVSAFALAGAICFVGVRPAEGNPPDDAGSLKTKAEIEALGVRYASAADAIGRGDAEEGRQIYRTVFTDDALVELFLPNDDPNAPPYASVVGPDAWTDLVRDGFAFYGYTSTHHQIGNADITVQGNMATMKSYVTATHVLDWSSSVNLATATYTDHVVRTPEGWRIAQRSLQAISYLHLTGTLPPLP